ncbi:MAG: ABC transporter ATP-binding protein [Cellulosilyticaceae bacterium]
MNIVVETKNLRKTYGSKENNCAALDNINLQIREGEFIGIMGPSGAGKTTLLNVIATIDKPSSGSVYISGKNILDLTEDALSSFRRNKLGFIFQDFNLLDTLTIKENIILPLTLSKIRVASIEEKVEQTAEALGLTNILEKYPYEVSGGQKQRTAAARAIINKPTLVLADEPTGALDSKSSKELLQCLWDLNEMIQATIMMVTHDAFAASYCKRIVFIKDGRLFTELSRGSRSRKEFYGKILEILTTIGS